jgi:hypothetical protein
MAQLQRRLGEQTEDKRVLQQQVTMLKDRLHQEDGACARWLSTGVGD